MRRILFTLALMLASCDQTRDWGGLYPSYVQYVEELNARDESIEISGQCYSSCVLKLAVRRVCVHANAILGVHEIRDSPWGLQYPQSRRNEETTRDFQARLPACAMKLFKDRGGFANGELVTAEGWEILKVCPEIKPCP